MRILTKYEGLEFQRDEDFEDPLAIKKKGVTHNLKH